MLSYRVNNFLRHSYARAIFSCRNFASENVETDPIPERDPAPYFFNRYVQSYLKKLTTVDYTKVFRSRKDGHRLKPPEYKFLTDEQLQEAVEASKNRAKKYLQMPPVVRQRRDPTEPICKDPALRDHDNAKFVFTDITFGLNDRDRFVVVREPDGTLRHANWQERNRIVQIYYPQPSREMEKPKMFEDEYLQSLLDRKEYTFILDRACVQFEPDDPDYQAVTRQVYEHINNEKEFDILRSTRHFGPMVFHLVWTKNIDNLLCEMIETGRIGHAATVIRLFYIINPAMQSVEGQHKMIKDNVELIMNYTRLGTPRKSTIEKLLQSYKELQEKQKIVEEGIKQAHGITSETDKV